MVLTHIGVWYSWAFLWAFEEKNPRLPHSDVYINIPVIKYNTVFWFQSEQDPWKRPGAKRKFLWKKQFNKKARAVQINIMKLCSTDRKLRLVNEITWRHVCISTSSHRCFKTPRYRRLPPPPPPPPPPAIVTSLMDGPKVYIHLERYI